MESTEKQDGYPQGAAFRRYNFHNTEREFTIRRLVEIATEVIEGYENGEADMVQMFPREFPDEFGDDFTDVATEIYRKVCEDLIECFGLWDDTTKE